MNSYDYIIVGAGSAGCVLANRLSTDPNTTVLLLEAGKPDNKLEIRVPIAFNKLFKSELDWNYETEPQPHLNNRQLYWPRGKTLGGCSSINAMIYMRGNAQDYDRWAASGCSGWRFADVLPYFKRAQHQERGASAYHATNGPLNVADLRYLNPLSKAFVNAGIQIGLPYNNDFNGASQEGIGYYQVNQRNGSRHSTATAYLKPILSRPNLTILTQAHATRILFEMNADGSPRATAIELWQNGLRLQYVASKEIILSSGAINSPQLLMLSGIGDADQLTQLGIPVVHHLPGVGQNLHDHPAVPIVYHCTQSISLANANNQALLLPYLFTKKGILTSNIAEAGGFITTRSNLPYPDLQLHFAPTFFIEHGLTIPKGHGFTIGATLVQPQSRGYLALQSPDSFIPPLLQPNYLATHEDCQTLLNGLKLSRKIIHASAFNPYRGAEMMPGEKIEEDSDLLDYIRQNTQTLYHPVGSCKMGTDPLAVVNTKLQVYGVHGLRVVDASIMPSIVGGNTNAPTIMIAEKAADLIKGAALPHFA